MALSVRVNGLEELARIPGFLERAQREHLNNAARKIARAIGDAAPRRSGRLANSWQGRAISDTKAIVESESPYAKSQARGAYITPKKGKALRFQGEGEMQFAKFTRLPATNYDKIGLRQKGKIIREEYSRAFGNIK